MPISKYYDKSSKKWLTISNNNANEVSLTNPNFASSSNVSEGFDAVDSRLTKLEKNIAYLYKNGTLGSSGSNSGGSYNYSGGTISDSIQLITETIISNDKNYIYINGKSTSISFYIKAVSSVSKYYVTVTVGGVAQENWDSKEMYSLRNAPVASSNNTVSITNITANTSVIISAVDTNGNELNNMTVYIKPSTYSFSMDSYKSSYSYYYDEASSLTYTFYVTNNVPNSNAILQIKCQGNATKSQTTSYAVKRNWQQEWYFTEMLGTVALEENSEYNITAELYITTIDASKPVDTLSFSVSVASAQNATLAISGTKISKSTASDNELVSQYTDETVNFSIKVLDKNYSTHYLAYKFYYDIKSIELDTKGEITSIVASSKTYGDFDVYNSEKNEKIIVNTVRNKTFNVETFPAGVYYIVVRAWAVDGNGKSGTTQKTVKGRLTLSDNVFFYDYNENHTLAVQYNAYKDITNSNIANTSSSWISTKTDADEDLTVTISEKTDEETGVKTTVPVYDYDNIKIADAREMIIVGTNGNTSGFVTNDYTGNAPALRLSGKSYAYIPFAPLFPSKDTGNCSCKMQNYGFTISITFKSDKHPDANGTILDIGDWTSKTVTDEYGLSSVETTLSSGIHIGLNEVLVKFINGNQDDELSAKLIQGEITTIDIVYERNTTAENATFKLYINGVCSGASYFSNTDDALIWAESNIWFACRNKISGSSLNVSGIDRLCDVNIYDFKIYAGSLNEYAIVRNYINARARVELVDGSFDWKLIKNLRERNYMRIDKKGKLSCAVTDNTDDYKISDVQSSTYDIYEEMLDSTRPIPVVLLKLASDGFYKKYHTVNYGTQDRNSITELKYDVDIVYTPETGGGDTVKITKSSNSTSDNATSPKVSLQGTSTLTYSAKNLEINLGSIDGTNNRLFTPKAKNWLPENRFTLKADVIDSSHCNNAAIGKFINESGVFDENPSQTNTNNPYRKLVKHTLEGFPCYLFIKFNYSDPEAYEDLDENISTPQFMGIYSFNLGRGAYYNTGFKVLKEYILSITDKNYVSGPFSSDIPALVKSYTESDNPYPDSAVGCISYECDNNDNEVYSFQQDSDNIINNYYTERYPGTNNEYGFKSFKFLFTILANCYTDNDDHRIKNVDKTETGYGSYYVTNTDGTKYNEEKGDEIAYYTNASTYYTFEYLTSKLNWSSANSYYLLCMALGLVDSLGKNATYRSWNVTSKKEEGQWYCCFYDMDTGLGLNNYGQETVEKTVYTRKIKNVLSNGFSDIEISKFKTEVTEKNEVPDNISNSYSTWNSRLWNVVTEGILSDGNVEGLSSSFGSFRDKWYRWRSNEKIFASSDEFVNKYYKAQIEEIGEIMYNMDYRIKYINPCTSSKYKDVNSISFLHGRRTEYVADWLKDRLYFLDSIFYYNKKTAYKSLANEEPENYPFFNIASIHSSTVTNANSLTVGITSASPCIWYYTVNESEARSLLYEDEKTNVIIPVSTSNAFPEFNLLNLISSFENFGDINWMDLADYKAVSITEFNLSNTKALTSEASFGTGSGNIFRYMTELRSINLQNTKISYSGTPKTGLSVDISNCSKLLDVDISNSHVSSITFPSSGCLQSFNAQNSLISSLSISDQPFMSTFNIKNCSNLKTLKLINCHAITEIDLTGMPITSITLSGCSNLKTLTLTNCTLLKNLDISECYNLSTINMDYTCTKIESSSQESIIINLRGCKNLTTLDCTNCYATKILLNSSIESILTSLKLEYSHIYKIQIDDSTIEEYNGNPVTDLSIFTKLTQSSQVTVKNNSYIVNLRFRNNQSSPFIVETSTYFNECSKLQRIFGCIQANCKGIFKNLPNFFINEVTTYTNAGITLPDYTDKKNPIDSKSIIDKFRYSSGTTEIFFTGLYDTNVKFDTKLTDFSYTCAGTSITIYDMYYVLSRADNATDLQYCFLSCSKIETSDDHPLSRYTFSHCGNVENIIGIFYSCTKIKGPIFSPTIAFDKTNGKYDGLYSPLTKCVYMATAFYNTNIEWVDTFVFYTTTNSVLGSKDNATFNGAFGYSNTTSVKQAGVDNTESPLKSAVILKYIPKLRNASSFFGYFSNKVTFEFNTAYALNSTDPNDYMLDDDGNKIEITLLFHNNPNITTVNNCFPKWKINETYTSQKMIFKGQITATLFGGGGINGIATFVNPVTGEIEENCIFSKKITNFGGFLRSTQAASKSQFRLDWDNFDTFFDNQNKVNISDACQIFGACDANNDYITKGVKSNGKTNSVFPTKIFEGMTGVQNLGYFFCNHGIKNDAGHTKSESIETVELPGDMFKDCYKLTNIEYIFKNTDTLSKTFNFYVKLTSGGFINCPLENVQYSFSRVGIPYSKKDSDYLGIPYKFFYMGYNNESVKTTALNFDDSSPLKTKGSYLKPVVKATIANMSGVFEGNTYFNNNLVQYSSTVDTDENGKIVLNSNNKCGELIDYNTNYDPRQYIVKTSKYTTSTEVLSGISSSEKIYSGNISINEDETETVLEANIDTPAISSTSWNTDTSTLTFTLNSFYSKIGTKHSRTEWLIYSDYEGTNQIVGDLSSSNLITKTFTNINLETDKIYYLYVRFIDNSTEQYSSNYLVYAFTKTLSYSVSTRNTQYRNPDYNPLQYCWNPYAWDGKYRSDLELGTIDEITGETKINDIRKPFRYTSYDQEITYNDLGNEILTDIPKTVDTFPDDIMNNDADKYCGNQYTGYTILSRHDIYEEDTITRKNDDGSKKEEDTSTSTEDVEKDTSYCHGEIYGYSFSNYLVPSDLFRYCKASCSVDKALSSLGCNSYPLNSGGETKGNARGRIQPLLFKTLTSTASFSNLFSGCYYTITPWIPARVNQYNAIIPGEFFADETFEYNTALTDVSYMFTYMVIPRNTKLPSDLFSKCTKISNASYMLRYTKWGGGTDSEFNQLGVPFSKCGNYLKDVTGFLELSDHNSSPSSAWQASNGPQGTFYCGYYNTGGLIKYISDKFLSTNKSLTNADYMFFNQSGINSTVCELWNNTNYVALTSFVRAFYNCSGIKNYSDIPVNWKS